ncbi:MAG: hypothetical protein JOZ07_00110 [Solirubrobacterales bacterium]|nr:hypothetical protein [Solirubrobacterales bacterium]
MPPGKPGASAAEVSETAEALERALTWLLAMEASVRRGEHCAIGAATEIRAADVRVEIDRVRSELEFLRASDPPETRPWPGAGFGFVLPR